MKPLSPMDQTFLWLERRNQIVADGQALNITLNSYADKMEFGITACRRALPHIQRLLDYLEQGLRELEGAA